MIFKFKENGCMLKILTILDKDKSKYSIMFKETKVSHTTLQKVLKYLVNKNFVIRKEENYKEVTYWITPKGKQLQQCLLQLQQLLL